MTSFGVALEITPPRERRVDVLLRRARLLGGGADAVHVIQRPGRLASLDASLELARAGVAAVWHITNRGRTRVELETEIRQAARGGLRAALVVRGESGSADRDDTPTLRAVVARIGAAIPGARVGVTLNPYLESERVLASLWPKLEAGAAFVQTQPVFELSAVRSVAERIRARAPTVAILPMVIPLVSAAAAEKLALRLRLPLPAQLVARLENGGEAAGWRLFAETLRELRASGLADGVAVMTQELDPSPEFGARIRLALERSAVPDPS